MSASPDRESIGDVPNPLGLDGIEFIESSDVHTEDRGALTRSWMGGVMFELVHDARGRGAERRAAPKPAPASRETRLYFPPSESAQADSEPRRSVPPEDRPTYSLGEGQTS